MKTEELEKGSIYIDVIDKDLPLRFNGKIEKSVNLGFNCFADVIYFEPIKNEKNKNWFHLIRKEVTKNFFEGSRNNSIIKKQ